MPTQPESCIAFSQGGSFAAIVQRRSCRDAVSIVRCGSFLWQNSFDLSVPTEDLSSISFSPDESCICACGSPLDPCVFLHGLDGTELVKVQANVRCAVWSPDSKVLAIGTFEGKVVLLDPLTKKANSELDHPLQTDSLPESTVVFREVDDHGHKKYEVVQEHVTFESQKRPPQETKAIPSIGVSTIRWAPSRPLLATVNESTPQVVWIWDAARLTPVSVLVHSCRVRDVVWAPFGDLLAVCTGDDCLRLWSPAGCSSVVVPHDQETEFQIRRFSWNPMPSARQVILIDRDSFCCCSL